MPLLYFQRSKGLVRTGAIDLPTLEKLDQYTLGPLKVRKAIKSKLDDISGNYFSISYSFGVGRNTT